MGLSILISIALVKLIDFDATLAILESTKLQFSHF